MITFLQAVLATIGLFCFIVFLLYILYAVSVDHREN